MNESNQKSTTFLWLFWIAVAIVVLVIVYPDEQAVNTASDEKTLYASEMKDLFSPLSESSFFISNFFKEKPYPISWTDSEKVTLAVHIIRMQEIYSQALKINPPENLKLIHDLYLSGLKKYRDAALILPKAIANRNIEYMNQTIYLMDEGNALINKATKEIKALQQTQ